MRMLKSALVISSAVFFSIACSTTETTNHNASQTGATASNANASPAATGVTPAPSTPAATAANTNQPSKAADEKKKDDKAVAAQPASNINGSALFTSNKCVTCHGADGNGKVKGTPNFTDAAWQKKEKDSELAETIKKGKKPMPPYAGKLSDDEIKALVAYVRSFGKK